MDPNATLARMREISTAIDNAGSDEYLAALATELRELTDAMDQWLSKGGALPEAWQRKERTK